LNILIIGNGFDLAHGLKTKYDDFLSWAYENSKMGEYEGFDLDVYWRNLLDKQQHRIVLAPRKENEHTPKYIPYIFRGFGTWIDLENNIAWLIEQISKSSKARFDTRFTKLFDEFLVGTFEQYISEIVNSTDVREKYPIHEADRVLSFNYSNTFERLYNPNANICYVNGKASQDGSKPHIVFGCDYYDYNRAELSKFNKIVQRANIGADGKYRDWLRNIGSVSNKIYIVGHSLGKTDWEIVCPFVTNEKSKTTVYYHNETSKHELIHRMLGMVGKEFMVQRGVDFKPISKLEIVKTDVFKEAAKLATKSY
jgi:hypothetical protein